MTGVEIYGYCFLVPLMIVGMIVLLWYACSPHSPYTETITKTLYTYYKKGFDDTWEAINSWCVKYCSKEFPKYHDEIFLDKSEISYESCSYELEKIDESYRLYVRACKFPKLWEYVIPKLDAQEFSIIDILYIMEFICSFDFWKNPKTTDIKYCLLWVKEGVFETRQDVMGCSQYKIKDEFLGD